MMVEIGLRSKPVGRKSVKAKSRRDDPTVVNALR